MKTRLRSETENQPCSTDSKGHKTIFPHSGEGFSALPTDPKRSAIRPFGVIADPLEGLLSFRRTCRDVYRFLVRLHIDGIGCAIYPSLSLSRVLQVWRITSPRPVSLESKNDEAFGLLVAYHRHFILSAVDVPAILTYSDRHR